MRISRFPRLGLALCAVAGAAGASSALAGAQPALAAGGSSNSASATLRAIAAETGGVGLGGPPVAPSTQARPTVPGLKARIIHGVAYAPSLAPLEVKEAIWAGDKIRHTPYIYGGGHGQWNDAGYDCSGSVSYVLHAARLIKTSMDSSDFESWGYSGPGQWITVYTNPGHAFVEIAGIRFDTSAEGDPHPAAGTGPRWRPLLRGTPGFAPRHPSSL